MAARIAALARIARAKASATPSTLSPIKASTAGGSETCGAHAVDFTDRRSVDLIYLKRSSARIANEPKTKRVEFRRFLHCGRVRQCFNGDYAKTRSVPFPRRVWRPAE